jgi:outer membrane lipoprotein-sorting protein
MRTYLLCAVLTSAGIARAQTADQILKMNDDAHSDFKDLIVEAKLFVQEPGQSATREFAFTTWLKGEDKRLVRFSAPGDIKGMGMLLEGRDTMYAYLPGFQRVRRLGTHVRNQSLMGSDFGYEDMAESTYTGYYTPKLVGTEGNAWVLDLTLAPGKDNEFPRLKMWIDKKIHLATRIEFYDASGKKARTETRENFKKDEGSTGHVSPEKVTIIDHRRNDHKSWTQIVSSKINTGLSDDIFSQRSLVRGQ